MAAVVDAASIGDDYGFPAGAELMAFASAANRAANPVGQAEADESELARGLADARERLQSVVGTGGLLDAAATVAAFNGLVRVADGTGIELDDTLVAFSADLRHELELDSMAGAANTRRLDRRQGPISGHLPPGATMMDLFADIRESNEAGG